ncbi:hypothetical protein Ancab_033235 [Ancistrocladus abbreviatus]
MLSGLYCTNPLFSRGLSAYSPIVYVGNKSFHSVKSEVKTRAAVVSGEGDLLSYSSNSDALGPSAPENSWPLGIEMQSDAISFGTLAADTAPMVVVVDDEYRENEGDLIMAASMVTPEAMAFIVNHGTGIVCVSMKEEDLERLQLPLMVTSMDNEEKLCTAFTVSVVCA